MRWRSGLLVVATLFHQIALAVEKQENKEEKKPEPPRVTVTVPLAASAGATNQFKVRGQNLTSATELRFTNGAFQAGIVIKSKGKADVPKDADAKRLGDTQLEIELALPADVPGGTNYFVVTSPDGTSQAKPLLVMSAGSLAGENEPNGGFKQAQEISLAQTVSGLIKEAGDVDVFRFAGRRGQHILVEVRATPLGSSLDSIVSLFGDAAHLLASNDDSPAGRDSLLRASLPADGVYFVSIIDAHDKGGPAHVYLLSLSEEK